MIRYLISYPKNIVHLKRDKVDFKKNTAKFTSMYELTKVSSLDFRIDVKFE